MIIPARTPSVHSHFEDVLSAITTVYNALDNPSRVKAVLLTNPHNPLSRVYTPDMIRACMRFCHKRGMHFISDEVYALASLGGAQNNGPQFVSALAVSDADDTCDMGIDCSRTHVVWSPSKLFGISGIRVVSNRATPSVNALTPCVGMPYLSSQSAAHQRCLAPNISQHIFTQRACTERAFVLTRSPYYLVSE
jgi:aspartate/methionine/tyrosine aminotransferase